MFDKYKSYIQFTVLIVSITVASLTYFVSKDAFAQEVAKTDNRINSIEKRYHLEEKRDLLEGYYEIPEAHRKDKTNRKIQSLQREIEHLEESLYGG